VFCLIPIAGIVAGMILKGRQIPIQGGQNTLDVGLWILRQSVRSLLLLGAAGGIMFLGRIRSLSPNLAMAGIFILAATDVGHFAKRYPVLVSRLEVERFIEPGPGGSNPWTKARVLLSEESPRECRVMDLDGLGPPEAALLAGMETISGYDPMQVEGYVRYIEKAEGWQPGFRDAPVPVRIDAPEYDLLNVRWAWVKAKNGTSGWMERSGWLPRAFWVKDASYDPDSGTYRFEADREDAFRYRAKFERKSPGIIEVRVKAPEDGYLFLSEVFFPGWVASDSKGSSIPIYRVEGTFRLIPVGAGENEIMLKFRPRSFCVGTYVSILALLGWVSLAATLRKRCDR